MRLKYIMFDVALPIVFGEYFKHDQIKGLGTPTSAGFLSIDYQNKTVTAYGESNSLKLKSNPRDSGVLQRLLFPD